MTLSVINVASHLASLAATEPDRPALHVPKRGVNGRSDQPDAYTTLSFRELHELSDALAHGLESVGIRRGTRTILMVPPSVEFFALTFAMLKAGVTPVMIDPGMGLRNVSRCIQDVQPEAFIGVFRAHLARVLFGWGRGTIRVTVNVGARSFLSDYSLGELRQVGCSQGRYHSTEPTASDTAAILFTSGSTGVAKGVVYTHRIFAAQVEMLRETYAITPGEVDLCTFPLFALFGPALGMTCVVPDMDASRPGRIDPAKAVKQMRQFGVTNLFGSPAVLRAFVRQERRWRTPGSPTLPPVRRIISAGAAVPADLLAQLASRLPTATAIYTPYGATEALPVSNIESREILEETQQRTRQGHGVCVGRPVAGMHVDVIPIHDEVIPTWEDRLAQPPGTIGEFVVRGPVVTPSYYNRPEANRLAKIFDPQSGETLHRMGDVGYIDDRGRLWYCGRKSHRVVAAGRTYYTEMVENVFNTVPGVQRSALVGVRRGGQTYPVVCIEPAPGGWHWPQTLEALRAIAPEYPATEGIETFLLHRGSFPVDVRHNAKIFREKLAEWADRKLPRRGRAEPNRS